MNICIKGLCGRRGLCIAVVAVVVAAIVAIVALTRSNPQIIVVGHNNRAVTIIDKKSNSIVWKYNLSQGEQSNSVFLRDCGEQILFTTQVGAAIVDIETKERVWNYKPTTRVGSKVEVHSIVPLDNGGFMLFIAGTPAKMVEFSPELELISETMFDAENSNVHGQFRQATKAKNGNYLVSLMGAKCVVELNSQGEVVERYPIEKGAFAVREACNGDLLLGYGDAHTAAFYDTKSKSVKREITEFGKVDVAMLFMAQFQQIGRNRFMVANWSGHNKKQLSIPAPQLIEFNAKGDIKWMWSDTPEAKLGRVSGFYYSKRAII